MRFLRFHLPCLVIHPVSDLSENIVKLILTIHVARYIAFYSTTESADTAYIIGGQQMYSNIVAQYNDDNASPWQRLPNLNRGRHGHGSISAGDKTLVIGGWARESQE